jgi:DNA-binding PadR family transcriptional regulator
MPKEISRIMVLGTIAVRGPIGGYGIEKTFGEWAVDRWTTIAPASIYQQLRSLGAAGFIEAVGEPVSRATLYRCTAVGTERLHELLLALLREQSPQPLSLIPMLHFTPAISADELVDGLEARVARIDAALEVEPDVLERASTAGPSHVTEIFRLTWEGLRADRAWCLGYLQRLDR